MKIKLDVDLDLTKNPKEPNNNKKPREEKRAFSKFTWFLLGFLCLFFLYTTLSPYLGSIGYDVPLFVVSVLLVFLFVAITFLKYIKRKIKILSEVIKYGDFEVKISSGVPEKTLNSIGRYLAYKHLRKTLKPEGTWEKLFHLGYTIWGETVKFLLDAYFFVMMNIFPQGNRKPK